MYTCPRCGVAFVAAHSYVRHCLYDCSPVNLGTPRDLEPLEVVMEAELILMENWAEHKGCGCPHHLPWKVTG